MKLFEYLKSSNFGGVAMQNLRDRKYDDVEKMSRERLEQRPDDFLAVYMLALVAYYRDQLEISYQFYKRLCQLHKVKKKIQQWFVKNLVARRVYSEREYQSGQRWCAELVSLTAFREIRVELLKYRCVCLDKLERYTEVVEVCRSLRDAGFEDKHVLEFEHRASERLRGDQLVE